MEDCKKCHGTRYIPCDACKGGLMEVPCPECDGDGWFTVDAHEKWPEFEHRKLPKNEHFGGRGVTEKYRKKTGRKLYRLRQN